MDGQDSLRSEVEFYVPSDKMVEILDIIHVLSHLWAAAELFHSDDQDRRAFAKERCPTDECSGGRPYHCVAKALMLRLAGSNGEARSRT